MNALPATGLLTPVPLLLPAVAASGCPLPTGKPTRLAGGARVKAVACPRNGCEQWLKNKSALQVHLRIHTGGKLFACPYEGCVYLNVQRDKLHKHLRVHTGEKPFVCSYENCGRAFAQSGQLTVHLRAHAGKKIFSCPREGCGYAFVASSMLTRHFRSHSGEAPFVCPYAGCEGAFSESGTLKNHLRTHTGEKPFVCSRKGCGRAFAQAGQLARHGVSIHSNVRAWPCPHEDCGKEFAQAYELARHSQRVHSRAGPFVCWHEGCGYSVSQKGRLKSHLRDHLGGKFSACPYEGCVYLYGYGRDLGRHLRVHAGGEKVVCRDDSSRRAFVHASQLEKHRRVHSRAQSRGSVRKKRTSLSVPSGRWSGKLCARRERLLRSQRAAGGKRLPLTLGTPPGLPSPVGGANPCVSRSAAAPGQWPGHQGTWAVGNNLRPTMTASCAGRQLPGENSMPPDRAASSGPQQSASSFLQVASPEPAPSPVTEELVSDWLTGLTDANLSWQQLLPDGAFATDGDPPLLTEDDMLFWRALYSSLADEIR